MFKRIRRNVQKESGECSRRFREMFEKIPKNFQKDSGEYSERMRGMFQKIPRNLNLDLPRESFFFFFNKYLFSFFEKYIQKKSITYNTKLKKTQIYNM